MLPVDDLELDRDNPLYELGCEVNKLVELVATRPDT